MAVASRCETHVMKLTNWPINGIVGSASGERALQAISPDAERFLFLILFNKESAKGSKGLPLCLPKATS